MGSIHIEAALKRFGSVKALDGVSLTAQPGEFVVLLGPSGSGKTTLLRAVAGLERLDGGAIWRGEELVEAPALGLHLPPEVRRLGMVFQEYALWPHLTVLENVALPLRERRLGSWRKLAQEALEGVGLEALTQRLPHQLSGGQQQRVALARAIASHPQVLLFDEPLSNLDAQLREELRLLIARLAHQHGITALYITHDQSEAFFLADKLGVMREGQLLQFDRPEVVYHRPAHPFVARFTGAQGGLEAYQEGLRLHLNTMVVQQQAARTGRMRVYFRPESLRLHHQPHPQALLAVVSHCAYQGQHYQSWLMLEDATLVQAPSPQRLQAGERVWLEPHPDHLLVFAEGDK